MKPAKSILIRIMVFAFLALGSAPAQAQQPEEPGVSEYQHNVIGEAGLAIFGRVFGVEDQGSSIDYYTYDLSGRSPRNAAVRSALVPGWGQQFNRQKTKGFLFTTLVVAGALGTYYTVESAIDAHDDYLSAGRPGGSDYDDYERLRTQAFIMGGVTLVIWGISVWDAYANAYQPLYTTRADQEWDLAFLEDGARMTWRRRFP